MRLVRRYLGWAALAPVWWFCWLIRYDRGIRWAWWAWWAWHRVFLATLPVAKP